MRFSKIKVILTALLPGVYAAAALAQTTTADIEARLAAAEVHLAQMESLAAECQPAIGQNQTTDACRVFLGAMHGDLLQDYSGQCASVRAWRDEQIELKLGEAGSNGADADAQQLLTAFMRAEYLCGADALSKRSERIVPVYRQLNGQSLYGQSLMNQMRDLQAQQRDQDRRWQDQRSYDEAARQQRRITDELFQRQQQDLLRQEMQRQEALRNPLR